MTSSNCCFLTCIQVSQEAGQVVWYSHLFQNFPQFIVIHTGKGFGVVNKAEIDVFVELPCFFNDPVDVGNWISGSAALSWSSHEEITYVQGKRNPSKTEGTGRGDQGADRLKPQSQKTSQSDHRTTAFPNSMKLSHAVWGHPRQTGHGGEV